MSILCETVCNATVDIRLTTTQAIWIRILLLPNTNAENLPSLFLLVWLYLLSRISCVDATSRRRKTVGCTLSRRGFYCAFLLHTDLESLRNRSFRIELQTAGDTIVFRVCEIFTFVASSEIFYAVNTSRKNEIEDKENERRGD